MYFSFKKKVHSCHLLFILNLVEVTSIFIKPSLSGLVQLLSLNITPLSSYLIVTIYRDEDCPQICGIPQIYLTATLQQLYITATLHNNYVTLHNSYITARILECLTFLITANGASNILKRYI